MRCNDIRIALCRRCDIKKSVCQIFNKSCLETGLKPDIPTINATALEYVKNFSPSNVPVIAFSDNDFDETIASYLPYPVVKVVPLGRTLVESKKIFPSIAVLNAYAQGDQNLYTSLEDRFQDRFSSAFHGNGHRLVFHLLLHKDQKSPSLFHDPFSPALLSYALDLCEPL